MQSATSINLVKPKINFLDEFLKWALNIGRLLVIIVEIVAFSSFLYRFSLDRTLIDLHDQISQQQAIVASLEENEKTYRNLQERISVVEEVSENGGKPIQLLKNVISQTPGGMIFNSFTVEGTDLKIDANVTSVGAMTIFVNSLREMPEIASATIASLNTEEGTGVINVVINAKLK